MKGSIVSLRAWLAVQAVMMRGTFQKRHSLTYTEQTGSYYLRFKHRSQPKLRKVYMRQRGYKR